MYSFFAFALKVCKKCYYDPKNFLRKNINMGIKIIKNFMLISNLLMPHCNKTFRRHPDLTRVIGQGRGKYYLLGPGLYTPKYRAFPWFRNIPEIFSVEKRKRGRSVGSNLRSLQAFTKESSSRAARVG